jgi:hypothetical protein
MVNGHEVEIYEEYVQITERMPTEDPSISICKPVVRLSWKDCKKIYDEMMKRTGTFSQALGF